jgi:peptidoglycan hydrolase-like protein with peptidoglycan-binding domain
MKIEDNTACSTKVVHELDRQLIFKMNSIETGSLVSFADLNVSFDKVVWPYLQSAAKIALGKAISDRGMQLQVNSAYRTIAQQLILFDHHNHGNRCGIVAAAPPGGSNHQSGLALDIEDADGWKPFLEKYGWQKLGDFDPMHFDFVGGGTKDISSISVLAFQKLWNENNPQNLIAEDGRFGRSTDVCLAKSPMEGFPRGEKIPDIQAIEPARVLRLTQPQMQGDDVRNLQAILNEAGIDTPTSGIFDSATEQAVKQFQIANRLSADGIVGPATRSKLEQFKTAEPPDSQLKLQDLIEKNRTIDLDELKQQPAMTRQIQLRLNALGLLRPSDVDGGFGPMTESAIARFSDALSLNVSATRKLGAVFAKKLIEARGLPTEIVNPIDVEDRPSTTTAFSKSLEFTLPAEGGFVDNPLDPGGRTNKGIIQSVYDSYRRRKGLPLNDVLNISDAEVDEIYANMYWRPAQCDLMVLPLAVVHFDTAVNFGVAGAIMFLQEALGVAADGIFGPRTMALFQTNNNIATANKIITGRIAYRHQRVAETPSQEIFLNGWLNRDNNLRAFIQNL